MRLSTFKEIVKDLPGNTLVKTSCMTKDYALAHDDFYNPGIGECGCLEGYALKNSELKLSDLLAAYVDDVVLQLDVEDGFIFHPVEEVVVHKRMIILF